MANTFTSLQSLFKNVYSKTKCKNCGRELKAKVPKKLPKT